MMQGNTGCGSRWSTFEPPPYLRSQLLFEGSIKGKEMEIDSMNTQMKETCPWAPKKCIPQAPLAPKYVIISPIIE
jgi:hypothetical protein